MNSVGGPITIGSQLNCFVESGLERNKNGMEVFGYFSGSGAIFVEHRIPLGRINRTASFKCKGFTEDQLSFRKFFLGVFQERAEILIVSFKSSGVVMA